MLLEITKWLIDDCAVPIWNFCLRGGYITGAVIILPVIRKCVSIMRQFTN